MNPTAIFNINLNLSKYILLHNNNSNKELKILIDTQAGTSLIKLSALENKKLINKNNIIYLKGITKEKIPTIGTIRLTFYYKQHSFSFTMNVIDD